MKEDPKKPKGKNDTGQKAIKKTIYSRLIKEKEKMDKSKDDVVTERGLMPKFIDTQRGRMAKPGSGKMSPSEAVNAGLFTEKNGDLYPTAKYQQMKKTGQLKGKFNIN